MNRAEIESCMAGMVILVDTREQATQAFRQRVRSFGTWERHKLDAGDYSAKLPLPGGDWYRMNVVIERKMDLDELAACYCRDRGRFKREFERASQAGDRIYLLVENASWDDVYSGRYHSRMASKSLVASILAWMARYDCQIIFCRAQMSGRIIHDILYREGKEMLMRMIEDV